MNKEGQIRQYDAIYHDHSKPQSEWLKEANKPIEVNLFGKIITLIINKALHLDPQGIGLSYEANKPGWNDAMNGIPGLFASGVSEMVELRKLSKRLLEVAQQNKDASVYLLESTDFLLLNSLKITGKTDFELWDARMTLLESYRSELEQPQKRVTTKVSRYLDVLTNIDKQLDQALEKALKLGEIIPTYLAYEVTEYELLDSKNASGLQHVKAKAFKLHLIPNFLEGPARLLKTWGNDDRKHELYKNVLASDLYDKTFKFYKTSVDLTDETPEIGRIHAFTKGWLERESNFLHMGYKYLYAILKSGLYEEFFENFKTNYVCFMDPEVYGRPVTENSTFIAPSNNPDPKKHGQGFVSRLTGSTAEIISMWKTMFFGKHLFELRNNELVFAPKPILKASLFKDGIVEVKLFTQTIVKYHNLDGIDTFSHDAYIDTIEVVKAGVKTRHQSEVVGVLAKEIRDQNVEEINVYIKKRKEVK